MHVANRENAHAKTTSFYDDPMIIIIIITTICTSILHNKRKRENKNEREFFSISSHRSSIFLNKNIFTMQFA